MVQNKLESDKKYNRNKQFSTSNLECHKEIAKAASSATLLVASVAKNRFYDGSRSELGVFVIT